MKVLFDRFALVGHTGPFRAPDKSVTTRHATPGEAPVPPSLWQRMRLFEVHDLHALHRHVRRGDVDAVKRELAHPRCDPRFVPPGREPVLFAALGRTRFTLDDHPRVVLPSPSLDVLQALLDDPRVDTNTALPHTQETVLRRAIEFDQGEAVARLARKADVAPTLLAEAILRGRLAAARALHAAGGADVHEPLPEDGRNALTLAAAKNAALLEVFLADAAVAQRVNEPDARGETPLTAATRSRNGRAVKMLLKSGASVDQRDAANQTALWHAVDVGWHKALVQLVVNSTDQDTAWQAMLHAIARNDVACAKALAGARGTHWSMYGKHFLSDMAKKENKLELARVLRPSSVWAMQSTAVEIIKDLRDEPDSGRRMRRLEALASDNAPLKIFALSSCPDLQESVAQAVELLVARGQWAQAAALVSALDTTMWTPSPELLRRIFSADDNDWARQREQRRTVADAAGTALIEALQRDPTLARSWQEEHQTALAGEARAPMKTLASRLAAIVIADMVEGPFDDEGGGRQALLDNLFALQHLSATEQAALAAEALGMAERCSGDGIDAHYASCRGDYDFLRSDQHKDRHLAHFVKLVDRLMLMSAGSTSA